MCSLLGSRSENVRVIARKTLCQMCEVSYYNPYLRGVLRKSGCPSAGPWHNFFGPPIHTLVGVSGCLESSIHRVFRVWNATVSLGHVIDRKLVFGEYREDVNGNWDFFIVFLCNRPWRTKWATLLDSAEFDLWSLTDLRQFYLIFAQKGSGAKPKL